MSQSTSSRTAAWAQAHAGWQTWAQRQFPDNPARAAAAAEAALRAVHQRATTEQAKAAGLAAGASAAGPAPTPNSRLGQRTPPGKLVGIARNVKQTTQFGTLLQIIDFELQCSDGHSVRVQIRGNIVSGRIDDGDEVVVDRPRDGSRFIQTDRAFNRTWNSVVEAPKGGLPGVALTEAAYGKGAARWQRRVTFGVLAWVAAVFILVVSGFVYGACQFAGPDSGPPAGWCDQARTSGVTNAPGC